MGLAAYGEPKYFEKLKDNLFFEHSDQLVKLNLKFFNHQKKRLSIHCRRKTYY